VLERARSAQAQLERAVDPSSHGEIAVVDADVRDGRAAVQLGIVVVDQRRHHLREQVRGRLLSQLDAPGTLAFEPLDPDRASAEADVAVLRQRLEDGRRHVPLQEQQVSGRDREALQALGDEAVQVLDVAPRYLALRAAAPTGLVQRAR
jgi:hypothetical protein